MTDYASEIPRLQNSDNPEDWFQIGRVYANGIGVKLDEQIASHWYRKAANAGSIDAMLCLSFVLNRKWSSDVEKAESMLWLRRSVEHGSAKGMFYLGTACREGLNTPVNFDESLDWFTKAYEAGYDFAAFCAGMLLAKNKNQHLEAIKWIQIAASHEQCPLYLYNLALIYEDIHSPAFLPSKAYQCWCECTLWRRKVSVSRHARNGSLLPKWDRDHS